jgi:hypothetical protein
LQRFPIVTMMLKSQLIFGLAVLLGALIWLLSPTLTGHREAWDASASYYLSALIIAGFLPACLRAERFWRVALGAWVGQMLGFVWLLLLPSQPGSGANLWPLGLVFLALSSVLSLVGAALGAGVHLLLRRLFSREIKAA